MAKIEKTETAVLRWYNLESYTIVGDTQSQGRTCYICTSKSVGTTLNTMDERMKLMARVPLSIMRLSEPVCRLHEQKAREFIKIIKRIHQAALSHMTRQ